MTFTFSFNHTVAIILMVIYLAFPTVLCTHAVADGAAVPPVSSTIHTFPCDTDPCSGGHDADCCDTTGCNCACHAPLGQGVRLAYAPVVVARQFYEPSGFFPQVYRTIFVPPQNLA